MHATDTPDAAGGVRSRSSFSQPEVSEVSRKRSNACPDDDTLAALVDGTLDESARHDTMSHVESCVTCAEVLGDALAGLEGSRSVGSMKLPEAGDRIGRYELEGLIGAGGMGIVFTAHDPELARRVAIKLLRTDATEPQGKLQERLLREARSLARLAHPNVVTVYDVGTFDGGVFVAMEYVEGGTLSMWLRERPRTLDEIADVLRQAAEGIAAAHEVGIVHRDVKPDNVLVGADQRVRVSDFGLARHEGPDVPSSRNEPALTLPAQGLVSVLTRTGALLGTPAYMAPEQAHGGTTNSLSDQYSFCVMSLEAITGVRPPPDGIGTALQQVPLWMRRVLTRGLSGSPSSRWPSMRALLVALDRGRRNAHMRPWIALGTAGFFVLVLAAALFVRRSRATCDGGRHAFDQAWGEARKARVRASFESALGAGAAAQFALVDRALEAYRTSFESAYVDACEATRVRGVQSESMLDQRMRCLDDRRRAVESFTSLIGGGNEATLSHVPDGVVRLPSIADCSNPRAMASRTIEPSSPAEKEELEVIEKTLADAEALLLIRDAESAKKLLDQVDPKIDQRWGQLRIKATLLRADAEFVWGSGDRMSNLLHQAAVTAMRIDDGAGLADTWVAISESEARANHVIEAHHAADFARACIFRLGGDPPREVRVQWALALAAGKYGDDIDTELVMLDRLQAYIEQNPSVGERWFAHVDEERGNTQFHRGNFEEAVKAYERVLPRKERIYGPAHTATWVTMHNRAEALTQLGRTEESIPIFEHILASTLSFAYLEDRLGLALRRAGRVEEALVHDRRGVEACDPHGTISCRAMARLGVVEDLLLLDRANEAISPAEEMLVLDVPLASYDRADLLFAAARALDASGKDRTRAARLAREAREKILPWAERYGNVHRVTLERIDAWLARAATGERAATSAKAETPAKP